jgi:Cytochrome b(N-terminal)/b6/petB
VALVGLGTFEGFAGYSLTDDLLSGMGLVIAYAVAMSLPLIGGAFSAAAWGGGPGRIVRRGPDGSYETAEPPPTACASRATAAPRGGSAASTAERRISAPAATTAARIPEAKAAATASP